MTTIQKLLLVFLKLFIIMIFTLICPSLQFNIDTTSPITFHPSTKTKQLFGFSLSTLHTDSQSFLVGAPLSKNREGVVTGHVYRCHVNDVTCQRLETTFSTPQEETSSRGEMFGSNIVHLNRDQFVTCAPSYKVNGSSPDKSIVSYGKYPTGECYTANKINLQTLNITMRLFYHTSHYCSYAQLGLSLDINRNNDLILGAPGFSNWKGGVFILRNASTQHICPFNSFADTNQNFSYFGYSVTTLNVPNATYFAVGGPRWQGMGKVIYFNLKGHCELSFRRGLESKEFGSYYGHSVTKVDIEGDGVDELVVGAPFSKQSQGDEGRVYVYKVKSFKQINRLEWALMNELKGDSKEGSRYGWVVQGVGDVDMDGFEDLLISAPLEESGMAYLHYGSQEGYDDSRVQKFPLKASSSFRSIIGPNGYPNILAGISESNKVLLFESRPVHAFQVNMSISEVSWSLHSCNLKEKIVHASARFDFFYIIPEKEFKICQYKNVIKDLQYKVMIDERGFVDLENEFREQEKRRSEIEGELQFSDSPGHASIQLRLSFPYEKTPKDLKTAIKLTLFVVEKQRMSGPLLKKSQQIEFIQETRFEKKCLTQTCKSDLKFSFASESFRLTLSQKQVSVVESVITNNGEAIFNTNFTFTHPKWTQLRSVSSTPSCLQPTCKRAMIQRKEGYIEEECNVPETLMKTTVEVSFLLAHSIIHFNDSTADQVMIESSSASFDPSYDSHLTVINTSSDSASLHKTASSSSFSTTHLYDIRTNATHPAFQLAIQEPFRHFENDVCCHNTTIQVEFRNGEDVIKLPNNNNEISHKTSLIEYLKNNTRKSIKMSCFSCDPLTFDISSLNNQQSIDVTIKTRISGELLTQLQTFRSFSYHTHLLLTPDKVTTTRKFFNSIHFKTTTQVYEVTSLSSAATKAPPTPIWLVILCVFIALIVVLALVMSLKKCGFFKRDKHEFLIENKRKSKLLRVNEEVNEGINEGMNEEDNNNEEKEDFFKSERILDGTEVN